MPVPRNINVPIRPAPLSGKAISFLRNRFSGEPAGFDTARSAFQAAALAARCRQRGTRGAGGAGRWLRSCRPSRGTHARSAQPPPPKCASAQSASKYSLNRWHSPRWEERRPPQPPVVIDSPTRRLMQMAQRQLRLVLGRQPSEFRQSYWAICVVHVRDGRRSAGVEGDLRVCPALVVERSTSCRRGLQPEMPIEVAVAVASASARSSCPGGQGLAGLASSRSGPSSRSLEPLCLWRSGASSRRPARSRGLTLLPTPTALCLRSRTVASRRSSRLMRPHIHGSRGSNAFKCLRLAAQCRSPTGGRPACNGRTAAPPYCRSSYTVLLTSACAHAALQCWHRGHRPKYTVHLRTWPWLRVTPRDGTMSNGCV